jgi:hypothetical protein
MPDTILMLGMGSIGLLQLALAPVYSIGVVAIVAI